MLDKVYPPSEDGAPGRGSGNRAASLPPPDRDRVTTGNETWKQRGGAKQPNDDEIENEAQEDAENAGDGGPDLEDDDYLQKPTNEEFLQMVAEASQQSQFYSNQVNKRAWERAYMAYRQQHFTGSKYNTNEFKNRSRLFVPKTRSAIRKDLAATQASLFSTIDTISVEPGNESDPRQRGGAAVVRELINYRTDGANGKAAMPWFLTALGSRQTALLTGFCVTKQSWKLEMRRKGEEEFDDEEDGQRKVRDVWVPHIDRPDCQLIPPENCTIDPACDWTNPAQDSAYFIIRWPMRIDQIKGFQNDPRRPWKKDVSEAQLKSCGEGARMEATAIRRSRDQGLDRYDESQTGATFDIIWVWESFIRVAGKDWTFFSAGEKFLLTDPTPVEDVYPEFDGERPLAFGYGTFEAFCVFPQAAAESWQQLQQEANDVRNLTLDAFKQNVMPVTKVVRGKQVDLDQLRRRAQGSAIMVNNKDDVTWERPPDVPPAAEPIRQHIDVEFDDLAGQQNYGSVQNNNSLGQTLGGLKLAAGSANAVQEMDLRVWNETWAQKALAQLVKLEQYYESDQIVLGIAGDKAELFVKHGISEIDDELIEQTVTTRVSIGIGAGDPQQRLMKFTSAAQAAMPFVQLDPRFKSGEMTIDGEAIMAETFGGVGYRDGGKRFIKKGQPQNNPMQQPEVDDKIASAALKRAQAKKAIMDALSNAAKVGIQLKDQELQQAAQLFGFHLDHVEQVGKATEMGHTHGTALAAAKNAAKGLNPDGTPMQPPGAEGGGPPAAGGGGAQQAAPAGGGPPQEPPDPNAGITGVDPATLGNHGVPAANAGAQEQQNAAAQVQQAKKKYKIGIVSRGPDNRANQFHVEEA